MLNYIKNDYNLHQDDFIFDFDDENRRFIDNLLRNIEKMSSLKNEFMSQARNMDITKFQKDKVFHVNFNENLKNLFHEISNNEIN